MAIPLRVLIIEDSDSDAALNVRALEKAGYKITHELVSTAEEMKAVLHTQTFDLIISDHNLPQFDSFRALALLKESDLDIPFLVVSGTIGEETAVNIMKAGAHDYVMKGNLSRLGTAVERELRDLEVRHKRKQAEEGFRNSLDNSPLGIRIVDTEDNTLYANQAVVDIFGLSNIEELRARPAEKRLTPESYVARTERLAKMKRGETVSPSHKISLMRNDGKIRQAEVYHKVIIWDGKPRRQLIYQDITDREQAQETVRESEEKFRAIFDNVVDGILVADVETERFYSGNKAICQMLGYSLEELRNLGVAGIYLEEDVAYNRGQFGKLARREISKTEEIRIKRKDGSAFYVEVSASPVAFEGKPCLIGIFRDVTERKRAEEEHKNMQAQLILNDRLASIGQLASGIAHELNNPLTGVIGFSELLMKRADLSDEAKGDLKIVNDEARRAANVVRGLLTFARKEKAAKEPLDINSLMQNVLQLRSYEHKVSNIEVNTQLAPELPKVLGNGGQLQQVFINLIVNAEQAMLKDHKRGTLTIVTERVGDTIKASVVDDGPGISKENMKKLFTPFFTTKEVGEGTGLGLSICHGIIAEHGGRIYAQSELGKGATFVMDLPIKVVGKEVRDENL